MKGGPPTTLPHRTENGWIVECGHCKAEAEVSTDGECPECGASFTMVAEWERKSVCTESFSQALGDD